MNETIENNRKFFDRISSFYDKGLFNKWLQGILRKALAIVNIKRGKVLDAGCGTGNLLKLLEKNKKLELYGIDISPKMLEIAEKKLKRAKLKLMGVENIKDNNKFDYIFSTEAFHHYSNHDKAMGNFYRALKKQGKLIVVDLNFGWLNSFFHLIEPGNTKMFSNKEMKKLFLMHKFRNIKQENLGWFAVMTLGEK